MRRYLRRFKMYIRRRHRHGRRHRLHARIEEHMVGLRVRKYFGFWRSFKWWASGVFPFYSKFGGNLKGPRHVRNRHAMDTVERGGGLAASTSTTAAGSTGTGVGTGVGTGTGTGTGVGKNDVDSMNSINLNRGVHWEIPPDQHQNPYHDNVPSPPHTVHSGGRGKGGEVWEGFVPEMSRSAGSTDTARIRQLLGSSQGTATEDEETIALQKDRDSRRELTLSISRSPSPPPAPHPDRHYQYAAADSTGNLRFSPFESALSPDSHSSPQLSALRDARSPTAVFDALLDSDAEDRAVRRIVLTKVRTQCPNPNPNPNPNPTSNANANPNPNPNPTRHLSGSRTIS